MKTPTVHAGDQGGPLRGRQNGGRRAALIGRRLKQGRGRARFTRGSKHTGVVWRPRHVDSRGRTLKRSGISPWQHCRPKFGSVSCNIAPSTEKKHCSHPSTVPPDIMRNGLQLLARHSLQHYTARVRVNPKSRDQDDDVKPERISRVIEHRTARPSDRALNEPSRRNRLSDLSVVHRRTLLISLPRLTL